ncbi:MAG: PorV/PorQ family protein [Bacteroidales bacterium]|nr:PorV/PorQ family protein [Bacteroidales bacterium]
MDRLLRVDRRPQQVCGRFEYSINEQHSISLNTDVNKLLVPTPPVYETDTVTGNMILLFGKEAPEFVLAGMFQSFYDAPGILKSDGTRSVLLEEMYEITYGIGLEYRYRNLVAIRTGYFHEHSTKGNRKYFTVGMGVKLRYISFDASYSRPVYQYSPLSNTFRLTLITEFGKVSNQ